MRILLGSKYGPHGPRKIGGVQSWVATVRRELEQLGHQVVLYEGGQRNPHGRFDLGVLANWFHCGHLAPQCDRVLNVSHGIIDAERPRGNELRFTSEEVRDHWGLDGGIVRQPIDLRFWTPGRLRRRYLTRFSYRGGLPFVPDVAKRMGLDYLHIKNASPRDAREALRQSAVVLATGRAALEAMACGARVVICDHRSAYQGPLLDVDTFGAMRRNYSGRGGVVPTFENVLAACRSAPGAQSCRLHVKRHHDAETVVAGLL